MGDRPGPGTRPRRATLAPLVAGPLLATALLFAADLDPGHPEVTRTAAVAVLMAVWWVTEAVPLAVTALLPMVLFPVLGIMDGRDVAPIYFNHVIFLFIGGFMVALAMQRWGLHLRIALRILLIFGSDPRGILLGFMVATAFLSMWISNTATVMMMVSIAMAVLLELEATAGEARVDRYGTALLLAVAYSASLGGIATLVGTPPNLFFVQLFGELFPAAPEISFVRWLLFGFPISLVLLVVVWLLLILLFTRKGVAPTVDRATFRSRYEALGPIGFEERLVLIDFCALALLWVSRADLRLGGVTIPGWSRLFAHPGYLNDGVVAVAMAIALFLIPSRREEGGRILDWATAVRLPWSIVLLFGGGFALGRGVDVSGLSSWIGHQLRLVESFHPIAVIAALCLLITFLTELTSNTATAEILLPILAALSLSIGVNPLLLMIPGTLSCSLAFMLPVATPPNAIVFGTGRLRIADMARTGFLLNLAGVLIVTIATWLLVRQVLGIDLAVMPAWAAR